MRRLIAYISMAITMLIAIGVAATPVFNKLKGGREFSEGREIVFNIKDGDELNTDSEVIDEVVQEFSTRLANYGVEDYSIKKQGTDTVAVSFSCDDTEFDYIARYLCFSGNNFAFSGEDNTTFTTGSDLIDPSEAEIEYYQDTIPVVVIPVTDAGKTAIEGLISKLNPSKSVHLRHEGETETDGGETESNKIFLWANAEDDDDYEDAKINPVVAEKILMSFSSDNIWYVEEGKEDEENDHTAIAFMCATATQSEEEGAQPQLDISKLKNDNIRAKYLLNMIKASDFTFNDKQYTISCPTVNVTSNGIDYLSNSQIVSESAESLVLHGNIATNKLFRATLVAIVIVSLLLVVYYRLSALAIVATTLSTIFVTILSFSKMTVLFNVPAVIGLIILAIGTLFGEIFYVNRFREEVYKGRSIKKANQEASKRSNLITLDASVIMAFAGLMMYVIGEINGGSGIQPLGVSLFFGAVFSLLMNLIVFKVLMYFVTNTTSLQEKYSLFNIDGNKVQNVMSTEQKAPYVGPYEKVDFTKKKKVVGIVFAALAVAAAAVITVFGVSDKFKTPLNVEKSRTSTTIIYAEVDGDNKNINDESLFKDKVLAYLPEEANIDVDKADVEMFTVTNTEFIENTTNEEKTYYFITKINYEMSDSQINEFKEAIDANLSSDISIEDVNVRISEELIYTPDQGLVALATGLSIIGAAIYAALRFGPSRGVATLVVSTGSTAIAYGIMAATRIATTAVTSLAMPIVALTTLLGSLFIMSLDKTMTKEDLDVYSYDNSKAITVKAVSKAAAPLFVFMLVAIYITINYFGFGLTSTSYVFISALVGELVGLVAMLVIMGPLGNVISNNLRKLHLPEWKIFEKKQKQVQHVRNSSEPEETTFIGIND